MSFWSEAHRIQWKELLQASHQEVFPAYKEKIKCDLPKSILQKWQLQRKYSGVLRVTSGSPLRGAGSNCKQGEHEQGLAVWIKLTFSIACVCQEWVKILQSSLSPQTQKWGGNDLDEILPLGVINLQNRSHVSTTVTVVRSTEYSNHFLLLFQRQKHLETRNHFKWRKLWWVMLGSDCYMCPVESFHYKLMGPSNHLQAVCVIELFRYILQKKEKENLKHGNHGAKMS